MPHLRQILLHLRTGCPISRALFAREVGTLARRAFPCEPLCPLWLKVFLPVLAITLTTACRSDMQSQPRQNPLSRSDFYPDQRSERPPVEGTVARGQLHDDTYFYTGKAGNNPGDYMPFAVTKEVLERGRERYNIYCA